MQRGLGSTAPELRLHVEKAGERGPGETEGLGANQRVSHVADEEAELTEATDATEARRWPQNGRWITIKVHGYTHRARERRGCSAEGATERGERVSGCELQKRARARGGVARKRAIVGASTAESAGGRLGKG
jgi:hypothetical protein